MRWTRPRPSTFALGQSERGNFEGVVLLLPETIRAEEDNKSHLFEQRTWRRAAVYSACASLGTVLRLALRSCEFPAFDSGRNVFR
jgi:hypothetical protein